MFGSRGLILDGIVALRMFAVGFSAFFHLNCGIAIQVKEKQEILEWRCPIFLVNLMLIEVPCIIL
jgi:hypothetical protein